MNEFGEMPAAGLHSSPPSLARELPITLDKDGVDFAATQCERSHTATRRHLESIRSDCRRSDPSAGPNTPGQVHLHAIGGRNDGSDESCARSPKLRGWRTNL